MDKKQKELIENGYLHVRAIIEVVGKPKDYAKQTLLNHVSKIKEAKEYVLVKETTEPPEEKEGLFTTFTELELLIKDTNSILSFCYEFLPASVELIEPEEVVLRNVDLTGFLNDLLARSHSLNNGMIEIADQNTFMVKNLAVLLRNFIMVLVSDRGMTIEEIFRYMGVGKTEILKILEVLINEGKVVKDKEVYKAKNG